MVCGAEGEDGCDMRLLIADTIIRKQEEIEMAFIQVTDQHGQACLVPITAIARIEPFENGARIIYNSDDLAFMKIGETVEEIRGYLTRSEGITKYIL